MKRLSIAAAALLFGTSAYAMVPSTQPTGVQVDKDPYTVTDMSTFNGTSYLHTPQPAAVDWWDTAEPVTYTPVAYTGDEAKAAEVAVDKADVLADSEAAVAEVAPAAYETTAVDADAVPDETGVGGPEEGIAIAAADLAPRPAAQNYPACRPGRGDDNCIQLYEPGVRQQLASWNRETGGFAGTGETQVAMGGPYEPADSATETERLNQQALADSTSALQSVQMADATDAQAFDNSAVETARVDEGDLATDDEALVGV